jgi:hypothetical protein
MEVLHVAKKGGLKNTLEKFYTYNITHRENQINNKYTTKPNILLNMLILNNPDRRHQWFNSLCEPDYEFSLRLSGVMKTSVYAEIKKDSMLKTNLLSNYLLNIL